MEQCISKQEAMESALVAYQENVEKAVAKVSEEEQRQMEEERERITPDATFEWEVNWENKEVSIPKVEVTMKPRDWFYKVPQVTMKERKLSFDFVGTRMVDRVVGKKPEVKCEWKTKWRLGIKTKFWDCTTEWKDIITAVPEFYKERKEIILSLPEIAMQETRTAFSIPEMKMSEHRIVIKLPEFRLSSWVINPDSTEADAERARREAEESAAASQQRISEVVSQAQAEQKATVIIPINEFFSCIRETLFSQREAVKKMFDATIAQMEAAIGMLATNGAQDTPEATEYRSSIDSLKLQSEEDIKEIDEQIANLNKEEIDLIKSITEVAAQ